ncbi:MAG: 1-deoxy-D-xylulose-5-phosphate reductoisomerase [Muribaculaceae bacterium]|nr:1-deoxy-D-xylulose-5-phosphate reductoisomerase [Muribaculaceae bacterium]
MNNIKNIAILGSTGSIGRQTLDIISEYPSLFYPYLITANSSIDLLISQAIKYKPKHVIIANESYYQQLKDALHEYPIKVEAGAKAIAEAVKDSQLDTIVTAMVGYSGLEPTINAIKEGKTIALANKETLVVAGELITNMLKRSKSKIYPVDSEHSAIFQSLVGESHDSISKIILTASGGPFRTWNINDMAKITKADALNHPNWKMGAKITIDSATMMNKGFEVIEAKWLFDVDAKDIEVVVHPQSIVHSMVQFVDGSIKAQWGLPDMHLPIRYALGFPTRLASNCAKLKVSDYSNLTFESPDFNKFPMLSMAFDVIAKGGNIPCALNAANEIAVAAFLDERISYIQIPQIVENAVNHTDYISNPQYDDLVITNKLTRQYTSSLLK